MGREHTSAAVLGGAVALAGSVGVTAVRLHPHALDDASSPAIVAGTVLLLAGYGGYAWRVARAPRRSDIGLLFGFIAAACWGIEVWAGGPALLSRSAEKAIGGTFALAATVVTFAAGVTAAWRSRDRAAGWRAGLLTGAISGALLYAFAVTMTLVSLHRLGARPDYRGQFAAGHRLPTMNDFLINDILGAGLAHLVINVVLGAAGAAIGWLVLTARRDARPVPTA